MTINNNFLWKFLLLNIFIIDPLLIALAFYMTDTKISDLFGSEKLLPRKSSFLILPPSDIKPELGGDVKAKKELLPPLSFSKGTFVSEVLQKKSIKTGKNILFTSSAKSLAISQDCFEERCEEELEKAFLHADLKQFSDGNIIFIAPELQIDLLRKSSQKHFSGRQISIALERSSLDALCGILSEVSGKNILRSSGPNISISITLIDVPWDQILHTSSLLFQFKIVEKENSIELHVE